MKKVVIILIVVFIIVIAIAAVLIIKARMKRVTPVQVEAVERRDISQVVTAFGKLSPQVEVQISSKVIGQIEKLYVEEGDTVQKGDTLVELEKTRYVASVASAEANLRSARSQVDQVNANLAQARETLRKTTAMYEKQLTSEDALIKAQTQVDVLEAQLSSARDGVERAKAALEQARDDLNWTIMLAPVSGVVIVLAAEEGENVITGTMNNPGSAIMTIAQLEAMEAVVEIDEADVVTLSIGQEARIEVDAFPDTFMDGTVSKIANQATIQNIGGQETVANFEVKITVGEPLNGIRPGMSCTAEIAVDKADSVLSVPIQAVVAAKDNEERPTNRENENNNFRKMDEAVFVVEDDIAHQKIVTTGIADDRYIEIKSGVNEGNLIVIGHYSALRNLKDGDKVRIMKEGKYECNCGYSNETASIKFTSSLWTDSVFWL